MQEPEKTADKEKGTPSEHEVLDRIRAIEHPEWPLKDGDIGELKTALTRYSNDLQRLTYRFESRGAELAKLKAQYAELEHLWTMRPDSMRKAAEQEITALVRRKHELIAAEKALEEARAALRREKEEQAADAERRMAARVAELEQDFKAQKALLEERLGAEAAARARDTAEARRSLLAQLEEEKTRAAAAADTDFKHLRLDLEGAFQKEKQALAAESESWRRKGEEALTALAQARGRLADTEAQLEKARQDSADSAQKCSLAGIARDAAAARLREFENKVSELDARQALLGAREKEARVLEENRLRELAELRARTAAAEKAVADKRAEFDAAKLKMRAEVAELAAKYWK